MKFLVEPIESGVWVATHQDDLDKRTIRELVSGSDVIISDYDDTDLDSPGKKMVFDRFKSGDLNPKFVYWCLVTFLKLRIKGKQAETETWRHYVNLFLRNQEERAKIRRPFTDEEIPGLLYPGVQELYKILEYVDKHYMTRNIRQLVQPVADFLAFKGVAELAFNKGEATLRFFEENKQYKRPFIKGDSEEDLEILEVLNFYRSHRGGYRIEDFVSCNITDSPDNISKEHTITVGNKNYLGLVGIMQEGT